MSHLIGIIDILQQQLMNTAQTFKKYKKERIRKKMQEAEGYAQERGSSERTVIERKKDISREGRRRKERRG